MSKKIFLTGASRGIGKNIKQYFLEKGHDVYSPSREELDLSDTASVKDFIHSNEYDADVVINNASINTVETVSDFDPESFYKMMNVNFISPVMITNSFIENSINCGKGMSILNFGSIRMTDIKKGRFHYTMSKTCMDTYTKYVVHETENNNIICNTISPGYVNTDMLSRNNGDEKLKQMLGTVPLGRFADPMEIAKLCYFLCIDNTYINGQNIIVDGGRLCK